MILSATTQGRTEMEVTAEGEFRGVNWENLECPECGFEVNEEPDWDFMRECERDTEWE